ncbi:hypothetical protein [Aquabacterium sp.]|uniref:hypothetical protein n=1 Tax=Aquabacterium sp. TaxID=1872578 RepID=UPI002E31758A|nr:hypothetical protein [Aquabacterium sp.]HEX5311114.1 hypothetical protein [Aquabacterium sp.]
MTQASDSQVRVVHLPATLQNLVNLSALLERMDRSAQAPNPTQYRQLVQHIEHELALRADDAALSQLLGIFPATAQIYENTRYEVAGLCLSPLDAAVQAEQMARQCLQSLAHRP